MVDTDREQRANAAWPAKLCAIYVLLLVVTVFAINRDTVKSFVTVATMTTRKTVHYQLSPDPDGSAGEELLDAYHLARDEYTEGNFDEDDEYEYEDEYEMDDDDDDDNDDDEEEDKDLSTAEKLAQREALVLKYEKIYDDQRCSLIAEKGCYMLYNSKAPPCHLLRRPNRSTGVYRPDYFILGTRKGGTTSLATYISKHPLVKPINIRGLSTDGEVRIPLGHRKIYNSRFKNVEPFQFVGDSNVARLMNNPEQLQHNANASRFLILLRDPIERCYSQCLMRIRNRPHAFLSLARHLNRKMGINKFQLIAAMERHPERLEPSSHKRLFHSTENCWYEGLYSVHLKRLLAFIPETSIRIYWSDDFFAAPQEVVIDALKFIGADPDDWDREEANKKYNSHGKSGYHTVFLPKLKEDMRRIYRPFDEELARIVGSPPPWLR